MKQRDECTDICGYNREFTAYNEERLVEKGVFAKRCKLRHFIEADLRKFAAYRALPEIAQYQSWDTYHYEDALDLYRDLQSKAFALVGEWYQLAIVSLDSGDLIGDVAIHFMEAQRMEIGFTISPGFQRMGYAGESVSALLDYLFEEADAREVLAVTDAKNMASIRVLESLGFSRDPDATRQVIFKGEAGEEFDYSLKKNDWQALRGHTRVDDLK